MERLFTFLLSEQHAVSHFTVTALAFLCGTLAIQCLAATRFKTNIQIVLFGIAITTGNLVSFFDTLWSSYPYLLWHIPLVTTAIAAIVVFIAACISAYFYLCPRRTIKTVILAGCVLAFGLSFSAFTILVSIVKPFVLAYDLSAVLSIMVLGSTLCGFAFWELGSLAAIRPRLFASILLALTLTVLPLGSMGSVLPFGEWMTVIQTPDSASFSPIGVIALSEFIAIIFLVGIASLLDIRVAVAQQKEGDRIRHLADGTFEGLLICRGSEIIDANQRIQEMTGLDLTTLKHRAMPDLFVSPPSERTLSGREAGSSDIFAPEQLELVGPGMRRIPVEVLSRDMPYVDGQSAAVLAVRDITERKAAEEHIRYLALHDSLTSLPNRRGLEMVLAQIVENSRQTGSESAVLGLDLDGFKAVNDTLGHYAGDLLLKEVAARFQKQLRDSDYLARLGGDEFVIILRNISSKDDAVKLAKRLISCLWQPFKLSGHDAYVGVSIGIAVSPRDGDTAQMLLKSSDIAMYQAKLHGKGQVCEFAAGMDADLRERHDLELDLRRALSRGELKIHYQPLFDSSGKLTAFEALARWPHPERGMIPPDRFIPLAEETGLIVPLGEWVLRTACKVASTWRSDISIAVNLSPTQFQRVDLVETVSAVLKETGLEPWRLELEVTESLLMEDTAKALALVTSLRERGVRVALDDFGTGYSSLAYLHNFPFDKVKVDRTFINKITNDPNAWTIVESIIVMSHKLKLRVTAEGIETGAQLSLLKGHGCDEMQGFLLGRPMPETEASLLAGEKQTGRKMHEILRT
ncbi:EAL domain-containing protein [Acetobacter fallax]|uniref:EAL domain-containing protein n=1 Tax=Acetobacter fallax TaxID=1737473 RepID=A0ABX0K6B4_9PROT|nr:EAL domain-containing protein [Acetobacter fallax]NHO31942.1 EAL domain-containing protein [Acetobacter fallax]NHO35542.1 EAL domain-containing protein [Acetobacter fallax]